MKRKSSIRPYVFAALTLALLVLAAWVNRDRLNPVVPGSAAPGFEAVDLAGQTVSLDDYEGHVVLVNIWATWCPPCRTEMPSMQRLYEQFQDRPFKIVAVSVDAALGVRDASGNEGGDVGAFAESMGLTFDILHDPSGRIQDTYQTTGVPESFLIGKDGTIYKKIAGATNWDSPRYSELIERLLES